MNERRHFLLARHSLVQLKLEELAPADKEGP